MKIRFRPIYKILLLLSALSAAVSFFIVDGPYLLSQGFSMLRLRTGIRDISKLLQDDYIDPQTREFFLLARDIREFAVEELGLSDTPNYTSYAAVERDYLVDVVSAVRTDSLERYERSYPMVGKVFYRGYFKREQADRFASRLKRKGYDVVIRKVSAFSSLGIVSDPLYSYMAHYDTYRLAEMIIHEQVHSTVWIPGYNNFNEEIATFIGREGAFEYIRRRYGVDSPLIPEIQDSRQDYMSLLNFFLDVYAELEEKYAELPEKNERLRVKTETLERRKSEFSAHFDTLFRTERYTYLKDIEWNHALIDLYAQYGKDLSSYYKLFEHMGGSLFKTSRHLIGFQELGIDPHKALRESLQNLN